MNNENFLIENHDLELARDICKSITDSDIRSRAVANALAADIAKKYFTEIDIDTTSGIHNISQVLKDIDISDIYINGAYIDVRLHFNDNELFVPKSTFDMGIQPIAYMFIKIDEELSNASVSGFILPSSIDTTHSHHGYYKIDEADLISFYDIEPLLISNYDEGLPENFREDIFNYLDGILQDKSAFYSTLLNSEECRTCLKNAAYTQNIFNFVSSTNTSNEGLLSENENLAETEELINSETDTDMIMPLDDSSLDNMLNISEEADMGLLEEFDEMNSGNNIQADILEDDSGETLNIEDKPETDLDELYSDNTENLDDISAQDDFETNNVIEDSSVNSIDEATDEPQQDTLTEDDFIDLINDQKEENELVEEDFVNTVDTEASFNEEFKDTDFVQTEDMSFETNTTPSIHDIEAENSEDDIESLLGGEQPAPEETVGQSEGTNTSQELEDLFEGNKNQETEPTELETALNIKPTGSKFFPVAATLIILAGLGYYGYTKFVNQGELLANINDAVQEKVTQKQSTNTLQEEAMPIETIETPSIAPKTEEGNSISIPAIEQNLDASVMISNLAISWEVPSGYVANNIAKRYLTKMGKIIQLNLKTELMLLNKQPIANKMMVELEFNKDSNKFMVKGITASSGEKIIDDIVLQTVQSALNTNIKTNMSSLGDINGNPILIIRL